MSNKTFPGLRPSVRYRRAKRLEIAPCTAVEFASRAALLSRPSLGRRGGHVDGSLLLFPNRFCPEFQTSFGGHRTMNRCRSSRPSPTRQTCRLRGPDATSRCPSRADQSVPVQEYSYLPTLVFSSSCREVRSYLYAGLFARVNLNIGSQPDKNPFA